MVEHTLGKGEVLSSILSGSTIFFVTIVAVMSVQSRSCYARMGPISLLTRQMGTSIVMIEHHYSRLIPRLRADKLAGRVKI